MQVAVSVPTAKAPLAPAKPPPKPADGGQPMGQGGVYIDGGPGDDTVIMSQSAKNVTVKGGPGQDKVQIVDDSWGIAGLGPDGTLALVGLIVAAITVTLIAWRALTPEPVRAR